MEDLIWEDIMPYQFFTVPMTDDGSAAAELNEFLANHRVVSVDRRWLELGHQSCWVMCVEYIVSQAGNQQRGKTSLSRNRIDYKMVLSVEEFSVYSELRQLRKELAQIEAVPVYALFNNEQLAQMVQKRCAKKSDLLSIDGIGEAKVDKYLDRLLIILEKLPASTDNSTVP